MKTRLGVKMLTFSLDKLEFAREERSTYYVERRIQKTITYSLLTIAGKEIMVAEKLEDFLPKEWADKIIAYKTMKKLSE